jgi:hypothetical protein
LRELRLNYLNSNYNKWSTSFVKNSFNQLYFEKVSKEDYWLHFDMTNTDLIYTSLYQDLIQNYIIIYYKNSDEVAYKKGLEEVVNVFGRTPELREWVVKYIITGLTYLNNSNLLDYFTKKYNYKI